MHRPINIHVSRTAVIGASWLRTAAIAGLTILLLVGSTAVFANLGPLTVSFIDVGQGDSILLRAPDGTDILIDGGPRTAGPTVVAYLQQEGVDDIDVMVATHPDSDHIGGLINVLQLYCFRRKWSFPSYEIV